MGAAALRRPRPAAIANPYGAAIETPRLILQRELAGPEVRLALLFRPTLRPIGWIALTRRGSAAEICCWVQPGDRRRGLMSEAVRHCGPAIVSFGVDVLHADLPADDPAAHAVARRLGLRRTGAARGGAIRVEKDLCGLL